MTFGAGARNAAKLGALFFGAVAAAAPVARAAPIGGQFGEGNTFNVYDFIPGQFSWDEARVNAPTNTFTFGGQTYIGHLAVIGSAAENEFIFGEANGGTGWIGLHDSNATSTLDNTQLNGSEALADPNAGTGGPNNGGWEWVGYRRQAGQPLIFEPFVFQNFGAGEPNDFGQDAAGQGGPGLPPGEDAVHGPVNWNDNVAGATLGQARDADEARRGYAIEYEVRANTNPAAPPPPPTNGFSILKQTVAAGLANPEAGGLSDGTIDNMTEGEYLLANGGAPEATAIRPTIRLGAGDPFPGGGGDDFAIRARGVVDVVTGTELQNVQLTVNSDDGFALKLNGTEISRFEDPRGPGDTSVTVPLLREGDVLELDFFERGGGEVVELYRTDGGQRILVGDPASGILINIPEPTGMCLLAAGSLGLMARRRRT